LNSAISISNWFGAEIDPIMLNLVLPVGISFYTFQTVAYVIDVYNGIMKAEKHFGYYALFVTFFPQLVAGPIEKAQNLLPQFRQEHKLEFKNFKEGFALMAGGFIKKVVVADLLAQLVNAVYNTSDISSLSGLAVLVATVLFFIQIYCDFSAYSDIAIGCARLLGIKLMTNFNKPFSSQTVTEFWSRWHVSLTDWFNEYIYLPLTYKTIGKKHLMFYGCRNVLIVLLICGFWHGADWTFVIWGVWIGCYQCLEILTKKHINEHYKKHLNKNRNAKWRIMVRQVRTFSLFILPLVFFRANSLSDSFELIKVLFTNWSFSLEYFNNFLTQTTLTVPYAVIIALSLIILKFTDDYISVPRGTCTYQEKATSIWNTQYIYIIWMIILAWCFVYQNGQSNPFIYFQF
jgi:D-alanyl-lipoteichoic acid acyltransferase DltB (MBOAT superfamily)